MSGSLKVGLPSIKNMMSNLTYNNPSIRDEHTVPRQKRDAAKLLLMTLYNEFPLRPEEMKLMANRMDMLKYADLGWFALIDMDADTVAIPPDRLRAGITLLR
jgi:hypothetical protein